MQTWARSVTERLRTDDPERGDHVLAFGTLLSGAGLLGVLLVLVPFFVDTDPMPRGVYVLAWLAPIGFALAVAGMLAGDRARRRR